MKKLLQINTVCNSASTGKIAEDIGALAISKGWSSYIAYGRGKRPSVSEKFRIGSDISLYINVLRSRLFDSEGFTAEIATKKLINYIQFIKPDIIHLHVLHGYYLNIEFLFKYLSSCNIPIIWTLHDCWPFTGHCTFFDIVECNKWKTECINCPQKKEYPACFLFDFSKKNYHNKNRIFNSIENITLVPVSNWLKGLVYQSFLKDYPQKLIYNGVNLNVFYPKIDTIEIKKRYNIVDKCILLGVASIWDRRKGLSDFIKLSHLIDEKTTIILVGLTKKQLINLPQNIIGLERTENISQLVELYSLSNLFLNFTYEDNFPTTNIEALACGTPVLTYKTGGSIESVSSDTGFIVEKGDLENVMNVINLIKNHEKISYVDACRSRAIELYNMDDRYEEYFELYDKLIDSKLISKI